VKESGLKMMVQLETMLAQQRACWVLATMTDSFAAKKQKTIVATISAIRCEGNT